MSALDSSKFQGRVRKFNTFFGELLIMILVAKMEQARIYKKSKSLLTRTERRYIIRGIFFMKGGFDMKIDHVSAIILEDRVGAA